VCCYRSDYDCSCPHCSSNSSASETVRPQPHTHCEVCSLTSGHLQAGCVSTRQRRRSCGWALDNKWTSTSFQLSSAVKVVQSAPDLGVILDSQLSLSDHIAALCRTGFYQLRQIRPAIRSLTSRLMLPIPLFGLLSRVAWTGATRCCMVCRRTC